MSGRSPIGGGSVSGIWAVAVLVVLVLAVEKLAELLPHLVVPVAVLAVVFVVVRLVLFHTRQW
jgi:hypothetical protein